MRLKLNDCDEIEIAEVKIKIAQQNGLSYKIQILPTNLSGITSIAKKGT